MAPTASRPATARTIGQRTHVKTRRKSDWRTGRRATTGIGLSDEAPLVLTDHRGHRLAAA